MSVECVFIREVAFFEGMGWEAVIRSTVNTCTGDTNVGRAMLLLTSTISKVLTVTFSTSWMMLGYNQIVASFHNGYGVRQRDRQRYPNTKYLPGQPIRDVINTNFVVLATAAVELLSGIISYKDKLQLCSLSRVGPSERANVTAW